MNMDYKPTKNQALIEEFINKDWEAARVCDYTHKDANSCAWSINAAIKRFRKTGIKAIVRNNDVFLIKL